MKSFVKRVVCMSVLVASSMGVMADDSADTSTPEIDVANYSDRMLINSCIGVFKDNEAVDTQSAITDVAISKKDKSRLACVVSVNRRTKSSESFPGGSSYTTRDEYGDAVYVKEESTRSLVKIDFNTKETEVSDIDLKAVEDAAIQAIARETIEPEMVEADDLSTTFTATVNGQHCKVEVETAGQDGGEVAPRVIDLTCK